MNIEIVKQEKNEVELKVDNQTVAELLRAYLSEDVNGVEFAAWRKGHPSKPIIFRIETKGKSVKKAVSDAIATINKDAAKIVAAVKKK